MTEPIKRPVAGVFDVDLRLDEGETEPPGYRSTGCRLGPLVGAARFGATVYGLDPGESVCPYHYEYGREEWLLVLTGRPTLRTPVGEEVVEPGDMVLFPEGPDGAHKLTNRSDEPVRLVMFSNTDDPSVAFYPDSGKIGVWPPGKLFRERDAVDYWDGEA
jgi:uncharacterized cupin superfamily protein